jgi:endonuclease YncB( thermonuclease family)
MDVYDVDQYGRLLADVCGVRVGADQNILAPWQLAEECVGAGWAFTTPLHILPDRVARALDQAKNNMAGGGGLETPERPFQPHLCRRLCTSM